MYEKCITYYYLQFLIPLFNPAFPILQCHFVPVQLILASLWKAFTENHAIYRNLLLIAMQCSVKLFWFSNKYPRDLVKTVLSSKNGMEQVFSVTLAFLDGTSSNAAGRSVIICSKLTQTAIFFFHVYIQSWIWNIIVRLVMLAIYLLTEGSWGTGVQMDLKEMNWGLAFVPNICDGAVLCCVVTARWHQHIEWLHCGALFVSQIHPAITDIDVLIQFVCTIVHSI